MHFLILNGPNLNLLGTREPEVYGDTTLEELMQLCAEWAGVLGHTTTALQSNHEGELIDQLHAARGVVDAIVFNPGALTHTSYALHDAIASIDIPTVEVHISNVKEREEWRAESRIAPVCVHTIYGRGTEGYRDAIAHLHYRAVSPPVSISYGPEPHQVGDLRIPNGEGPHPLAVVVHGGFWRHQWTRDTIEALAVDLTNRGFASWNLEYSRSGLSRCDASDDISLAVATRTLLAHDYPIDIGRTVLIGHSAGAHLALEAAAATPVAKVVSLAGVTNLVRADSEGLGRGATTSFLDGAEPGPHCPTELLPIGVPVLLVHGTDDESVPVSYSDEFERDALARGDSVQYLRLDGVNHSQIIDPNHSSWVKVATLLEESLLSE